MNSQIIQLSSFLNQLNSHISQIYGIITEMNKLINEINSNNSLPQKLNTQIKQMNNLVNSMSLNKEDELKKQLNLHYNTDYFDKNNFYKKNIIFKSIQGSSDVITADHFTNIGDLLKLYLKKINKHELTNKEKMNFIFNSKILKLDDKRMVEEVFKDGNNHTIIVADCKNKIFSTPHYKSRSKK